jgi:hypothetical protein
MRDAGSAAPTSYAARASGYRLPGSVTVRRSSIEWMRLAGRAMSGPCSCANATDRNKVQTKIAKKRVGRRYMRVSLSFKGGRLAADKRLIDPKSRIWLESSEDRWRESRRRGALCQVVLLDLVAQLVAGDAQHARGVHLIAAGAVESLLDDAALLLVEG